MRTVITVAADARAALNGLHSSAAEEIGFGPGNKQQKGSDMETGTVRVLDIPEGLAADEVEQRINDVVCAEYYVSSIVQGSFTGTPGVAHRVFYKRRAKREDG